MNSFNRNARPNIQMNASLRQLIHDYNNNMRLNTEMMLEYNRNMRTILGLIPQPPARSNSHVDIASLIYLLSNASNVDDTPRGLTIAQVENAIEIITYDNDLYEETRCPISLDDFAHGEIICRTKHCNHIFKRSHLMTWLHTRVTCPSCRHDLRSPSVPPNSEEENEAANTLSRLFSTMMTDVSGNNASQFIFEFPMRFRR